jgi:hypothetical protein
MTEEPRSFNMNRPEANAKDEYLYLWQTYEIALAHLICGSDEKFDPRIPRMVRFMLSLIAHDSIRYAAELQFDKAIEYANNRKDIGLDARNEMIVRICATMCGNLTAYVDQFKGLAHQLKVGELVDMTKQYYLKSRETEKIAIDDVDLDDIGLETGLVNIDGSDMSIGKAYLLFNTNYSAIPHFDDTLIETEDVENIHPVNNAEFENEQEDDPIVPDPADD